MTILFEAKPGNVTADFLTNLDGGACVNQRSLTQALELFGHARAGKDNRTLRLRELLDALWTLDLLIAHEQVSYDGTLPSSDLQGIAHTADEFATVTGWARKSIVTITPPDSNSKLSMLANSADGLFGYLTGEPASLDKPFDGQIAALFLDRLAKGRSVACALLDDPECHRQDVLAISEEGFRGSKCVAGLIATGPEAVDRALGLAKRHSPGLAVSMLINRFRFEYLRALARSAGDVYVPGEPWRAFSRRNAALSFQSLSKHMDAEYLTGVKQALDSDENAALGVLPPLGLYCLMKADPTGGPRAVIDVAKSVSSQYRSLLRHLTKLVLAVGDGQREGWVQRSGVEGLERLEDEVDQLLTDQLGALKGQGQGKSPSRLAKYFTTVKDVLGEGTKATASGAAKNATQNAVSSFMGDAATAGAAAFAATALAGGWIGAGAGVTIALAGKGALRLLRHSLYGHIDSYRELHTQLSADAFQFLEFGRVEDRVARILGRTLVR